MLYVIEALLNCSPKTIKAADGDIPQPCGPGEKGEMQASDLNGNQLDTVKSRL